MELSEIVNWRGAPQGTGTGLINKLAQAHIDEVAPVDDELLVVHGSQAAAISLREPLAEGTQLRVRETTAIDQLPALISGAKARVLVLVLPDLSLAELHRTVAVVRRHAGDIAVVVVDDQPEPRGREVVALHAGADALIAMPDGDRSGLGVAVLAVADRRAQARGIGDVIAVDAAGAGFADLGTDGALAVLAVEANNITNQSQVGDIDTVMIALAMRLRPVLRPSDVMVRIAADSLVIARRGADELAVAGLADRILRACRQPLLIQDESLPLTVNVGISLRHPGEARSLAILVEEATTALASAQARGHATYLLFDEQLQARVTSQRQTEMALRHAIENHEFRVFYQPVIELATGRLASFEALMRWQRPQGGGLVYAAAFVEAAQRSGLMSKIGQAILREAAIEARGWPSQGLAAPALSVNLSSQEYVMPTLVASVTTVIRELGLEPSRLFLEIPRKLLEADPGLARATLRDLARLGVTLVADDFDGEPTDDLRALPIKMVKLRMGLLEGIETDPEARATLASIVAGVRDARWLCVGKGVETPNQAAILRELGCHGGQGFLFSGARAADELHLFRDAAGAWAWTPRARSAPTS